MNVFHYIAETNPYAAKSVCHSLGYKISNVKTSEDLGNCLKKIVAQEGEEGFKKVMEHHPDKDVLMELFGKPEKEYMNASGNESGCRCGYHHPMGQHHEHYLSFDGKSEAKSASLQANTFIIAAALILAVAVIAK